VSNMFFIFCIVALACATAVFREYFKARAVREKRGMSDETLAQIDALEERIRVLERIVTENRFDLTREIERL
jgi:ribosome-binding protein aMBF1 (putative translation factor)